MEKETNMNEPTFSIIIPLRNKEKYVRDTISSVLGQTFSDYELLIIDDGSTDRSIEIVESFKDERINLIRQNNMGASAARNRGIRMAKGKYISFIDADDYWTADFLETVLGLFEKYPEAKIACPSYQMKYYKRYVSPQFRSVSHDEDCLMSDAFEMASAPCWIMNSSCVAVEAKTLKEQDYWFAENERVYEDYDLWLRLSAKYPVAHSPKICSIYNRLTDSNARKVRAVVYSQTFMNTIDGFLADKNLTEKQVNSLNQLKDRRIIPYIFSLLLCDEKKKAKKELSSWKQSRQYNKHKMALVVMSHLPKPVLLLIQQIRLLLF